MVLFQKTVEPTTNPEPLTSSVKPALPSVTLVGKTDVIDGIGLLTVKGVAEELPPPGAGFTATKLSVPALLRSGAVNATVIWVLLENVAVCATPFTLTADVGTKPVPVMVTFCPLEPIKADAGIMDAMVGAGFVTVKDALAAAGSLETEPLTTVTTRFTPEAINEMGIVACS